MTKLLRPQVLIPVVFSLALVGALLAFSNLPRVLHLMVSFQHVYLLYFLLLTVAYEAVRGVQWHVLLKALDIHVPLRAQVFTFVGGEVTKTLPIGNYFQNYLLQVSRGTDFGRSSAATTLVILIEVAVSLVGVVILGLGSWGWVRPVIIVGVLAFGLLVWGLTRLHASVTPPAWMTGHATLRRALDEFRQFREGAADLFHPRILGVAGALGAVYLVIAGAAFFLVARGLGLGGVTLGQALAVYFFSLAVSLIFPLPIDLGVTEVSGMGAFLAVGVEQSAAVSVVLINRVLSIGAALAVALIAMAVLRDELRAVLHERSSRRQTTQSPRAEPAGD